MHLHFDKHIYPSSGPRRHAKQKRPRYETKLVHLCPVRSTLQSHMCFEGCIHSNPTVLLRTSSASHPVCCQATQSFYIAHDWPCQSKAMDDRPTKLAKLTKLRKSIPHATKASLQAILKHVKDEGCPELPNQSK